MDAFRPSFRCPGGDRIVSGKGFGANQMYSTTGPRSPDLHPITPRVTRPSQVAASSVSKPRGFNDSEMKRKRRIAKYKVYSVEGRCKASIKNGLRWIKNKCSHIIHGC
ncbi:unnamed protein product [Ilex paraguariensis]|uniref:DUF3511 domain protein n=2 Tax=Ilex paraguariensis TaxID=185542 RepID=A0ABC8UPS8_9AQUA